MTVPGIGPISATAIASLAPPAQTFARGRDFAAWLGLTPLQRSTGGKQRWQNLKIGRAHTTPPIDHRGKRGGALGCAQGSSCGILVRADAYTQAVHAYHGRTRQ